MRVCARGLGRRYAGLLKHYLVRGFRSSPLAVIVGTIFCAASVVVFVGFLLRGRLNRSDVPTAEDLLLIVSIGLWCVIGKSLLLWALFTSNEPKRD